MSHFYYSDSCFQLELNLQETRRELIALIEGCDLKDSLCTGIRCRCWDTDPTYVECEDGDTDHEVAKEPPLAGLLPKPHWATSDVKPSVSDTTFKCDIQSWLKSGVPIPQLDPSVTTSPQNYNKTGHNKKSPSTKMANKSVFDKNCNRSLELSANKTSSSTVREFCLKFAEYSTKHNSDFVMRKASMIVDNESYPNMAEPKLVVNSYTGTNAVDAFFRSFRHAEPATSLFQTNMPVDQLRQSSKTVRDYAYF